MADYQDTKYCSNCKRDIASGNFIMHEVHCRRNIVLCDQCHEPVPSSEMEIHFKEYHAKVACPLCNQQFEKSLVDEHKAECPKRSLTCEYCQLDMNSCDLAEHTDYCGTRTEQCPLCRQFVMLRDREQHDLSMCAYPGAKTSPVEANRSGGAAPGEHSDVADEFAAEPLTSFTMNELSRILHSSSLAQAPTQNNYPSLVSADGTRPAPANATQPPARSLIKPRPRLEINRNISRTSKNTNENAQSRRTNGNANNRQPNKAPQNRLRRAPRNHQPDMNEILAQHLDADLNSDIFAGDDFGVSLAKASDVIEGNNIRTGHELRHTPSPEQEPESDVISLPCEFCDELFPMDFLFEHQRGCTSNNINRGMYVSIQGSSSPRLSPSDTYPDHGLPNNSSGRILPSTTQPPRPQIVDNLSILSDWLSSPAAAAGCTDGETMLPCEFCSQLFPDELLVQHQAVCEGDVSPRFHPPPSRTPTARSLRTRSSVVGASGGESPGSSGPRSRASSRRQADPVFNFGADEGCTVADEVAPVPRAVIRGRLSAVARHGGRGVLCTGRNSNLNGASERKAVGDTTRPAPPPRGYAAGSHPRPSARYSRQTAGVRGPPQPATNMEAANAHQLCAEVKRVTTEPRSDLTFEQLLKDPKCSTDELLAAMDKEEKSNRNQKTRDQTHGLQPSGDRGDLSLSGAVNGGKYQRTSQRRSRGEGESGRGYDPSFATAPRPAPRVSNKPKLVVPREFGGLVNTRVGKVCTANSVVATLSTDDSGRPASTGPATAKRTNSRPRKAPQGEP